MQFAIITAVIKPLSDRAFTLWPLNYDLVPLPLIQSRAMATGYGLTSLVNNFEGTTKTRISMHAFIMNATHACIHSSLALQHRQYDRAEHREMPLNLHSIWIGSAISSSLWLRVVWLGQNLTSYRLILWELHSVASVFNGRIFEWLLRKFVYKVGQKSLPVKINP